MPFLRLSPVAARILAILLLLAFATPYVHAAADVGHRDECGMELCKRSGKCCCRRSIPGQPRWSGSDFCHDGPLQLPGPVSAVPGAPQPRAAFALAENIQRFAVESRPADVRTQFVPVHFQRPPPPAI